MLALCHRSLGGTVIAGVRQVRHVGILCVWLDLRVDNEIRFISNRVVFIKLHHYVIYVGENTFVNIFKWAGFSVSLMLTLCYVFEHSYLNLACIGVENVRAIDRNTGVAFSDKVISISSIISNLLELLFFIIIIYELLKHQSMHSLLFQSVNPNVPMIMARKNTVTSIGHFISWLIECVVFGTCHWILNSRQGTPGPASHFFLIILPSINYAVFPTAQVFTSPELRNHVFSPPYLPTSSCECFACASSEEDPQEDAAALQMVILQNGGVNL